MKLPLLLINLIVALFCLYSCNRTPDLSKDEIYKILNEIIADDSTRLYTICSKPLTLGLSEEYGFTEQDKRFIEKQKELYKDFTFETNKLKSFSKRKNSFQFIVIDKTCDAGIINRLSFPLISKDRQRVVFENTEDCHCELGGQGGQYLYVKTNGHWKLEKTIDGWISKFERFELLDEKRQLTKGLSQFVFVGRKVFL